jgi:Protein of unknown function VcgC/VcgE (DUF2780)
MVHHLGDSIMADIASELASKCGISVDSAQKGLGIVLGLLKSKLPAESFSKITAAVPGAESMMSSVADAGAQGSSSVLGAVKGVVGKLLGGGGATDALIANFGQLGMTPDQLQSFIPKVMEFLQGKLPANLMAQISSLLPIPQETAH